MLVACGVDPTVHPDADNDGWCVAPTDVFDTRTDVCEGANGFGDCDDDSDEVFPGAEERCNGLDDDCDGIVEGSEQDFDLDGWAACEGDCDDEDTERNPDATEICDGIDNDCNAVADDIDVEDASTGFRTFWPDDDGDGYGAPDTERTLALCPDADIPEGYALSSEDCDDTDPSVFPTAPEQCNVRDDDCDDLIDEDWTIATVWRDEDDDGFGRRGSASVEACATALGYARNDDDCDDTDEGIAPTASEVCDGIDNNCIDGVDENSEQLAWYTDADGDGYGDPGTEVFLCADIAGGLIADGGDCDDGDAAIRPGAADVCDGDDTDCDGVDNGCVTLDRFVATTDHSPVLRTANVQLSNTCTTDSWSTAEYGLGGTQAGTLVVHRGTRVHLEWASTNTTATQVTFPGATAQVIDAGPSGTFDFTPDADLVVTLSSPDTTDTATVDIDVVDHPYADPATNGMCRMIEAGSDWFPTLATGSDPIHTSSRTTCDMLDRRDGSPDCLVCDPWVENMPNENDPNDIPFAAGDSIAYSPNAVLDPAGSRTDQHHRVYGRPIYLPPTINLYVRWQSVSDGSLWYRLGFDLAEGTEDICTQEGSEVTTTGWVAPLLATGDGVLENLWWNLGPGIATASSPWAGRDVGDADDGMLVVPWLELRLPSPTDPDAEVLVSDIELYCCGPECVADDACFDFDGDGAGPFCDLNTWDCNDDDALRSPVFFGPESCANANWWGQECLMTGTGPGGTVP
jgi:hypothetical protein